MNSLKSLHKFKMIIYVLILMTSILVMGYSLLSSFAADSIKAELTNEREEIKKNESSSIVMNQELVNGITNTESNAPKSILASMQGLIEKNPDTVGWVKVDGTDVNNVVVQGYDNEYYLYRDFNNGANEAGTIFADECCLLNPNIGCNNIILYGHNQKDGSMFGSLSSYKKDPLKVNEYPIIEFNNNYETYKFKIFSMFIINTKEEHDIEPLFPYHMYAEFDGQYTYEEFKSQITKRSMINSDMDINENDLFITLSTCAGDFADARFVIVGRAIRNQDDLNTKNTYTINNDAYFPKIYKK